MFHGLPDENNNCPCNHCAAMRLNALYRANYTLIVGLVLLLFGGAFTLVGLANDATGPILAAAACLFGTLVSFFIFQYYLTLNETPQFSFD